jgi:pyruvate kinase
LRNGVQREGQEIIHRWRDWIERENFAASALNFAHYLAFRRRDIRPLQRRMMQFGLSSLGRAESRVLPTLDAVLNTLRSVVGGATFRQVASEEFFAGEAQIATSAEELFGPLSPHSSVRLMVTLPSEASHDTAFMNRMAELGVEAVRINCAHDDDITWARMIDQVDRAAKKTGWRMKIFMDLAGPKIRTGELRDKGLKRVALEEELAIALPGQLARTPGSTPAIECTLAEALQAVESGHRILIDDGKLATVVVRREPWGAVVRAAAVHDEKGYKLKPEKGVNFPDTDFSIPALTDDDRAALRFVAQRADAVEFSFVQSHEDVAELQEALARERPDGWRRLGIVMKIETSRAVRNIPDMLVRAAGRQPAAIMIARGDLAVEIGFVRLAEIQEELLWLGEAAHIPVIWATQVMESYLKTGVPTRGEMTDAAMAARAECVMLNKGPYLFEGIEHLDGLFDRMSGHMRKKTPQLRRLRSW